MRWMWAAWALMGCSGGAGTGDPEPVDFATRVRPMLAENCARCHGESRLAPGDFLDYATAAAWAEVMVTKIDAGEMPPPLADPSCHPYADDELAFVDPELSATLTAWVEAGKPEGDLSKTPEVEVRTPATLSRQDLVMKAAAPIAPEFVDGNEYRCFLLENVDADTYITGIEFLLDHPEISHHGLLFVDPDAGSEALVTDAASGSWICPDVIPEPEWEPVHAWAPSGGAVEFPAGRGIKVRKGAQLVMQMHYYDAGSGSVADQPGYALKLADTVEQELLYAPFGPDGFVIPAGKKKHSESSEFPMSWLYNLPIDVYGVMPHMHLLGTGYDFHHVNDEGAETCISRSDRYDFSTQPTYWFDPPVALDGTGHVSVTCTWDNSAANPNQQNDPPVDVYYGENTQEEMCFALMYVGFR